MYWQSLEQARCIHVLVVSHAWVVHAHVHVFSCKSRAFKCVGPEPALFTTGKLFCWGERNESSQLGLGQTQGSYRVSYPSVDTPVLNPTLSVHPYSTRNIVSVSAGTAHSAAVTELGVVYAWGYVCYLGNTLLLLLVPLRTHCQ
jgi:alpha-tubulin suppressor-like RCC1 family protein